MSDTMASLVAHFGAVADMELDDLPGVESVVVFGGGECFVFSLGGTYFEVRGWHNSLQREFTYRLLYGDLGDPAFGERLEAARLSELYAAGESLLDD